MACMGLLKAQVSLDPILLAPGNWELTPDQLELRYTEGERLQFKWLTRNRTRAKFVRRAFANKEYDLRLFAG